MTDNESRYNRLLQYLTDYIYTVEIVNGKVVDTYHGPGCVSVTGYTSEEYRKDPELWYRMVHEDDKDAVLEQSSNALKGLEVRPLEHRIIHKDGTTRWVKNSIVLLMDGNRVVSYDGLINDITGLKRAEELTELKQKQLIHADKMATLGTLVSGIAHEINNPNNFILLNAQLFSNLWSDIKPILRDYYDHHGEYVLGGIPYSRSIEKISTSLKGIMKGGTRIQKIVNSLTDFARKDSGNLNQEVRISTIIENAIFIAESFIKKSTDNFRVDYGVNIPVTLGNKQQLEQVLINVLNNACQALDSRDKSVELLVTYDKQTNKIVITVKDEGKGIEPKHIKHIFDPFYTTKRDTGGTGLGLAISNKIIQNHGGDIILDSEPGKGTTCIISIPVIEKQVKNERNTISK